MYDLIIAFNSRTETMRLADALSRSGVPSQIINTPHAISSSCGISLRISANYAGFTKNFIRSYRVPDSFIGMYNVTKIGAKTVFTRISIR